MRVCSEFRALVRHEDHGCGGPVCRVGVVKDGRRARVCGDQDEDGRSSTLWQGEAVRPQGGRGTAIMEEESYGLSLSTGGTRQQGRLESIQPASGGEQKQIWDVA
jgi:hypothetical protein